MDLIDRQAAIDAIINNSYPVRYDFGFTSIENGMTVTGIKQALNDLPSAQPHITHCAECIHWKHSAVRKNYCEVFDWMNTAEDFCSFAERRTDEQ